MLDHHGHQLSCSLVNTAFTTSNGLDSIEPPCRDRLLRTRHERECDLGETLTVIGKLSVLISPWVAVLRFVIQSRWNETLWKGNVAIAWLQRVRLVLPFQMPSFGSASLSLMSRKIALGFLPGTLASLHPFYQCVNCPKFKVRYSRSDPVPPGSNRRLLAVLRLRGRVLEDIFSTVTTTCNGRRQHTSLRMSEKLAALRLYWKPGPPTL